ncbi:MAG TPA: Sapep family Mn(2+)-dependent dipeptidase, partial [Atopostipes sp.]|nr:Sapep family Mn(2+)-dependent dipeptidase [Atopostipes sp.]
VEVKDGEATIKAFEAYLETQPVTGKATLDGKTVSFAVVGQASHGASPANGINAATYLADFLNTLDFEKDAKAFLQVIATYLHENSDGKKLAIDHNDELMGELTANFGIFRFEDGADNYVDANMRFPQGTDGDTILAQFKETLKEENVKAEIVGLTKEPHYVPKDDPLVETLLNVYHKQTGLEAHEMIIGGGTYGRLLERGVAFGAMFPDSIDTMHQANEFMAIDDLMRAMAIYAESIYELVK